MSNNANVYTLCGSGSPRSCSCVLFPYELICLGNVSEGVLWSLSWKQFNTDTIKRLRTSTSWATSHESRGVAPGAE